MKNIKNITKLIIYASLLMLFFFPEKLMADELVRKTEFEYTLPQSIIRHYSGDVDIVCHRNLNQPYFFYYEEGSSTSHLFYLDQIDSIYDFEIYKDTVYLCGVGKYNLAGEAVIGYFDVASFLSSSPTNVSYIDLPTIERIRAIEVGWFADRKHVVGIGDGNKSSGVIVDLIDEQSYWNINETDIGTEPFVLLDLAIIKDYIVVTSVNTQNNPYYPNVHAGRLWYIEKPATSGSSIFPSSIVFQDLPISYGVAGRYLIETAGKNFFVTAYQSDSPNPFPKPFIVSYYNGMTYNKTVVIPGSLENNVLLGDVAYDVGAKSVELLVDGLYETPLGMVDGSVVHEIPDVIPVYSMVYSHFYEGVYFESLDNRLDNPFGSEHFVSSGYLPSVLNPFFFEIQKWGLRWELPI